MDGWVRFQKEPSIYACISSFWVGSLQLPPIAVQSCFAVLAPTAALAAPLEMAEKVMVASPVPLALVKVPLAAAAAVPVVTKVVPPAMVVTTVKVAPLLV